MAISKFLKAHVFQSLKSKWENSLKLRHYLSQKRIQLKGSTLNALIRNAHTEIMGRHLHKHLLKERKRNILHEWRSEYFIIGQLKLFKRQRNKVTKRMIMGVLRDYAVFSIERRDKIGQCQQRQVRQMKV